MLRIISITVIFHIAKSFRRGSETFLFINYNIISIIYIIIYVYIQKYIHINPHKYKNKNWGFACKFYIRWNLEKWNGYIY